MSVVAARLPIACNLPRPVPPLAEQRDFQWMDDGDAMAGTALDPQHVTMPRIVRDRIYPTSAQASPSLGYAYQYEHLGIAETLLQQGGVRLATCLDRVFLD